MTLGDGKSPRRRMRVTAEGDVASVSAAALAFSEAVGFKPTQQYMIATAASELAWNIVKFAGEGWITLAVVAEHERHGMAVIAEDTGPGIADVGAAMTDHYSTAGTLGLGLPGTRRLMDEFAVEATGPQGTTIVTHKWLTS